MWQTGRIVKDVSSGWGGERPPLRNERTTRNKRAPEGLERNIKWTLKNGLKNKSSERSPAAPKKRSGVHGEEKWEKGDTFLQVVAAVLKLNVGP